eukprot:COSAG01_NODE_386_length_17742_cov_25.176654_1_plen_251_part_10
MHGEPIRYYHPTRALPTGATLQLTGAELGSAPSGKELPVRHLRVDFTDRWKALMLCHLNRAAVSRVLLHARDDSTISTLVSARGVTAAAAAAPEAPPQRPHAARLTQNVKRSFPRRAPSEQDLALIVTAARMATRAVLVTIDNQSPYSLLREDSGVTCSAGEWGFHAHPPHSIAPNEQVLFSSESHGMRGTQACVRYRYAYDDTQASGGPETSERVAASLEVRWSNPLLGDAQATALTQQAEGEGAGTAAG